MTRAFEQSISSFVLETQNLNIVSVANDYVSVNSRRLSYFGRF